ncbi:MAG: type II toxin-antitoxin system RelE/ParE family toxin [Clostridiales bacterium]|nr:type II toxin-antitoxin system RelE/ParE family toxin [Clostridiales bacterium]
MKEEYKVLYSPAAKDDLRGIYRYIAVDLVEPGFARKQIDRIREKIRNLGAFPKKHQAVDWEPWASMGMRRIPVDNYVVFYLVNDSHNQVMIVRIFYGGRDIENIISDITNDKGDSLNGIK